MAAKIVRLFLATGTGKRHVVKAKSKRQAMFKAHNRAIVDGCGYDVYDGPGFDARAVGTVSPNEKQVMRWARRAYS